MRNRNSRFCTLFHSNDLLLLLLEYLEDEEDPCTIAAFQTLNRRCNSYMVDTLTGIKEEHDAAHGAGTCIWCEKMFYDYEDPDSNHPAMDVDDEGRTDSVWSGGFVHRYPCGTERHEHLMRMWLDERKK